MAIEKPRTIDEAFASSPLFFDDDEDFFDPLDAPEHLDSTKAPFPGPDAPSDDYDPLGEDADGDAAPPAQLNVIRRNDVAPAAAVPKDTRTDEEKTRDYIASLSHRNQIGLGLLRFCSVPRLLEEVRRETARLQAGKADINSPDSYMAGMRRCGALIQVTEDGRPFDEVDFSPRVVEINGIEYLEVAETPTPYYVVTDAGRAVLADYRPEERLQAILSESEQYLPVYKQLLVMMSEEGGADNKVMSKAIDPLPVLKSPHRYTTYFTDILRDTEAASFDGSWHITDLGKRILEQLEGVPLPDLAAAAEEAKKDPLYKYSLDAVLSQEAQE